MNFENKKVVVIGDSILDQTIVTTPVGISLESPTLKVEETFSDITLGGAANVAKNILALGAQCTYVSPISKDEYYHYYDTWTHPNLHFKKLWSPHKNTVKMRVWVEKAGENYKYLQVNRTSNHHPVMRWAIKDTIEDADVIVLVDYGLGMFGNVKDILTEAKRCKIPVIASSQMSDRDNRYELFRDANYLCMNEEEAETCSFPFIGCITLGSKGCCWIGSQIIPHEGFEVDVKDPCGAGDAFLAALSLCLRNINQESLAFCNAWAAASTTKVGTVHPTLGEVYELLRSTESQQMAS